MFLSSCVLRMRRLSLRRDVMQSRGAVHVEQHIANVVGMTSRRSQHRLARTSHVAQPLLCDWWAPPTPPFLIFLSASSATQQQ